MNDLSSSLKNVVYLFCLCLFFYTRISARKVPAGIMPHVKQGSLQKDIDALVHKDTKERIVKQVYHHIIVISRSDLCVSFLCALACKFKLSSFLSISNVLR